MVDALLPQVDVTGTSRDQCPTTPARRGLSPKPKVERSACRICRELTLTTGPVMGV